jgi:4-aminobutyrate aminotransferase-like enzyme
MNSHVVGTQISQSAKITELIEKLTAEVVQTSSGLRGLRPARQELQTSYQEAMQKLGQLRGRELYYPFIGSGAGSGPYVELMDGSVKLDLINGIGIHLFGHSHPQVMKAAVRGALSDVVMQGNLEPNVEYKDIGERLVRLAAKKSRLRHYWLSTCGTMANENALKMARQKNSPARMIVAMKDAFAGRSTLMAEITDNPNFKVGLPEYNEVLRVPFYDKKDPRSAEKSLNILKEHVAKHPKNISVFTFEPVQGEGGFNVAPREFFVPMFDFCRQHGIAIWADEVQTFARTGEAFAFQTLDFGDYVDICTIAKTAQNGATLMTPEYNPQPGLISGTFSGSSSALTAGIEILRMLEEGDYFGPNGRAAKVHKEFVGMLNELNETTCKGLLQDAGGLGLMVSVIPLDGSKDKVNQLLKVLFKNGVIAFNCGKTPMKLRFLLPMVLESADIQVAKQVIEKSIQEMA